MKGKTLKKGSIVVVTLLVAMMMALVLAACGGATSSTSTKQDNANLQKDAEEYLAVKEIQAFEESDPEALMKELKSLYDAGDRSKALTLSQEYAKVYQDVFDFDRTKIPATMSDLHSDYVYASINIQGMISLYGIGAYSDAEEYLGETNDYLASIAKLKEKYLGTPQTVKRISLAGNSSGSSSSSVAPSTSVPTEYKNALIKAQSYSDIMYMSKAGLYDQLTSEYGEGFTAEAAQYAVDNVDADWNYNALMKGRSYQDNLAMSTSAIYEQLISEYGEKFTPEEAQYAVDNL